MSSEPFFNRRGQYSNLVQTNVLLHREASALATELVADHLARRAAERSEPIRWLDLACGGEPVTPAQIIGALPQERFDYTGIDINPDQIAKARQYAFPENVASVCLIEGNGWDLRHLPAGQAWDVAFVGMNLHHGTREEVGYLAHQLGGGRLRERGLFLNHECVRPDNEPYVRRPDHDPARPAEPLWVVEPCVLEAAGFTRARDVASFGQALTPATPEQAWKLDLIDRLVAGFVDRGGPEAAGDEIRRHQVKRDYPVSAGEICVLLEHEGFDVVVHTFPGADSPIRRYVALIEAGRS